MKRLQVAVFLLAAGFTACRQQHKPGNDVRHDSSGLKNMSAKVWYTCPMHPDIIQDKPGICAKCGMDLVEKDPE